MGHLVRLSYPEAPSGSWVATNHGDSATSATVYSDWDCTTVKSSRALNSSGRDTFYVKDVIDVTVYNASGIAVDAFTAGVRSELVGVNSLSWTGANPDGTQALGGHLPLPSLLTTLASSFGSTDGYVKETGQANRLLLKDALAAIRLANLPYYNVKAAPYNAVGNGVSNDSTAVQAAITAAAAAGGGVVYLPRGTYLCATGLTISNPNVSIQGDGPGATTINYTPASGYAITLSGGATAGNYITNVCLSAVSSGGLLIQNTMNGFRVDGCLLKTVGDAPAALTTSNGMFVINNALDIIETTASRGVIETTSNSPLQVIGNVRVNASSYTGYLCKATSSVTNGTVFVVGNNFVGAAALGVAAGAGTFAAIGNTGTGIQVEAGAEACTFIETGHTNGIVTSTGLTGSVTSTSRNRSQAFAAGASLTPSSLVSDNSIDFNANATINAPSPAVAWDGAPLTLRMRNTTGGAITMTYNAAYLQGGATPGNLAAGATRVSVYVRKETGTTPGWRLVSSQDST